MIPPKNGASSGESLSSVESSAASASFTSRTESHWEDDHTNGGGSRSVDTDIGDDDYDNRFYDGLYGTGDAAEDSDGDEDDDDEDDDDKDGDDEIFPGKHGGRELNVNGIGNGDDKADIIADVNSGGHGSSAEEGRRRQQDDEGRASSGWHREEGGTGLGKGATADDGGGGDDDDDDVPVASGGERDLRLKVNSAQLSPLPTRTLTSSCIDEVRDRI